MEKDVEMLISDEEKTELYRKALKEYGEEPQKIMIYEECGELITALARLSRGRCEPKQVITELADVYIMIEQMAELFGTKEFNIEKNKKLIRLKERLENKENKNQKEDETGS